MKSTETFLSSDGKHDILLRTYIPDNPKAALIVCHGMCEHTGRECYVRFSEKLCDNGIAVFSHDYIGHGPYGEKYELGFFSDKNGFRYVIDDVYKVMEIAKHKLPDAKLFLLGHSMGSLVARYCIAERPNETLGSVILGTLGPIPAGKLSVSLAKAITAVDGAHSKSKLLNKLSFGSYLNRIENPKTEYDWLCTDSDVIAKYISDPLCGFGFTNSAMVDLISIYEFVSRKGWASMLNKKAPVLYLSGKDDPCGGWTKGVTEIYNRTLAAGVPAELKLYEGRHELLNEPCKNEVTDDIIKYLLSLC